MRLRRVFKRRGIFGCSGEMTIHGIENSWTRVGRFGAKNTSDAGFGRSHSGQIIVF